MRDMLDRTERYPLTAWTAQFERMRQDLDAALKLEEGLAVASRTADQRKFLAQSVAQFWDAIDRMFALADSGKESEAREQIRLSLQARQQALSSAVSRLLVENNEGEEQAAARIAKIYDGVQRQLYLFLAATLIAIVLTSLYLIRSNRQLFARLAELSEQRSDLAQKLISTQESTLRHISRELHDEFGQVLTAIGSMLRRAGKQAGEGTPLHADLKEVREIAQTTLNNIRTLSQALQAGARGYVLKNAMDLDLVSAVKSIAAGMTILDPQVSRKDSLKGERGGGLTPRELEILQHIVAGKSNKEIASDLNLSVNTVAVHRANIMDTLGIHKTAELVVYAIRNGLVNLP